MFHLIPAGLHRAGLRAAHRARKQYWRLAKPALTGVTVIALDGAGQVLLVRHTYGSGLWSLPGGGLRRGEAPHVAAMREFAEELGCAIERIEAVGLHRSTLHGAPTERHVFRGKIAVTPQPDGREVAEARFFASDKLPEGCSGVVLECLAMAQGAPES